jgi:hypothetical protein
MIQPRQQGYIDLGHYSTNEVLDHVGPDAPRKDFTIDGVTYSVNMKSARMVCFTRNVRCVCCGTLGEVFLLELPSKSKQMIPHFNMYGMRKGEWVQMTKDHVVPRSKGGRDNQENLVTMCCKCNEEKADRELTPAEMQELVQRQDSETGDYLRDQRDRERELSYA